jgi:hypothetical protein
MDYREHVAAIPDFLDGGLLFDLVTTRREKAEPAARNLPKLERDA